jgi:steroid delta-isomerase-like uncharacterized protein
MSFAFTIEPLHKIMVLASAINMGWASCQDAYTICRTHQFSGINMNNKELSTILEANQALVRAHLTAENQHLLDETLATLHPDCVFEDLPLGLAYHGKAGAAEYYKTWWNAFSIEVKGIARHWTTEGNMIAETRYFGKHTGNFHGLAPTGRDIELRLAVVISFRDGLMLGERFYYDLSSLLTQLGVSSLPEVSLVADA